MRVVSDEFSKHAIRTSRFEYLYTAYLESKFPDLESSFNTLKPQSWCQSVADGYSKQGRFLVVVYNLRIEKMCTIFAKKSFEDRKNVQATSTGEAQGRATV